MRAVAAFANLDGFRQGPFSRPAPAVIVAGTMRLRMQA